MIDWTKLGELNAMVISNHLDKEDNEMNMKFFFFLLFFCEECY